MMANLFSIFDTSTNTCFDLNWLSSILNLLILPANFYLFSSNFFFILYKFSNLLFLEFKIIFNSKFNFTNCILFSAIFFLILINNIMGLYPYIFTSSSHMIFSMTLSFPLWMSLMLYGWINNTNHMFSHMIPQSTPNTLMPFMVLIETISNFIRPMTLTIRLTANMIAGHLLLTLLSDLASSNLPLIPTSVISLQTILLILEFSVSMIQSYVFAILVTLYVKETN